MKTDHSSKDGALNPRQQRLIIELTRSSDVQAAARAAGVGRTTAYRWLQEKSFADELSRARNRIYGEALSSIKSLTTRAARTLGELMETDDERLRRNICNDILRHAFRVREQEEVECRLITIENRIQAMEERA